MFKIKNLTYSPLRIIMDGKDVRLLPRNNTLLDKINDDILILEKKKLIKIMKAK
jgi:hypothetical protein